MEDLFPQDRKETLNQLHCGWRTSLTDASMLQQEDTREIFH